MQVASLSSFLNDANQAEPWLRELHVESVSQAHANLVSIAESGVTLDLLAVICEQLAEHLPRVSDPDLVLNNLERFVTQSRSPLALASLFDRDREALPTLLQILSASQYLSDLLISDPEGFDLLRMTDGQSVARDTLVSELCSEIEHLPDERAVKAALRRFKRRETMRIAYGDVIRKQRVDVVTRQISFVADAICEAAVRFTRRKLEEKFGEPLRDDGHRARFNVLALGKLGGTELNYSSDIDLVFLADEGGRTSGSRSVASQEFFSRLVRDFVNLLTEQTELGAAYRVDLRLRPEGQQGPSFAGIESALRYYDTKGRTWERQAFVKARPIAGDSGLGVEFLRRLRPWLYRRYLNRADITEIKALKRRIEQKTRREGVDHRNVKTGHGGIRDVEFVIQFLQLLNGCDLPDVRTRNTLEAIAGLEQAGCLTMQERSLLEENYQFLRTVEHRLQIMFDLQTHTLPESDRELRRLAIRLGYADDEGRALQAFQSDLREKTELNRKILDHLLHDAFGDDDVQPESDLILDPDPSNEMVDQVLSPHGFRDVNAAFGNLMALATEKIPFLSTRRCRHFLASIAPRLLTTIAATPDPDATLVNLSRVSDSLGGKGVLWELFSFNPPSLELYVRLCATSPYLSGILNSNPGMIDELMDSMMLDKLPTESSLRATLNELCRGAEDVDPILHSFKHAQHLRVGVRDILGKNDIRETHRALADIAEVCLEEITRREYQRLAQRYGEPTLDDGTPCSLVTIAMGKLGGREPNYHSDLDLVFLYEADGSTRHSRPNQRRETTTNQHFFSQLGQRITKVVTQLGPHGRLYELDSRLRPTGKSGALAISLDGLRRYFESGQGELWERQALCKARPIYGSPSGREKAMGVLHACLSEPPWREENVRSIRQMRERLEETATAQNLKRGRGGTVDVEFAIQMLQLKHAAASPEVLVPGTLDAIAALRQAGYLADADADSFTTSYRLLRSIESGLRLMNTEARHDLPEDEHEQRKLAFLLDRPNHHELLADCDRARCANRDLFARLFR